MEKVSSLIKDMGIDKPSPRDRFLVFMFGVDDALEREILRYVFESHRVVNWNQLVIKFVYQNQVCSVRRLHNRLDSLVSFGYLSKWDYRGTVFYEIVDKELDKK
jgi:hypothetical protein